MHQVALLTESCSKTKKLPEIWKVAEKLPSNLWKGLETSEQRAINCLVTCDPVYSPGVRKDVKELGGGGGGGGRGRETESEGENTHNHE